MPDDEKPQDELAAAQLNDDDVDSVNGGCVNTQTNSLLVTDPGT
jgi:hypothetical protein